jgi:hypothetical protein
MWESTSRKDAVEHKYHNTATELGSTSNFITSNYQIITDNKKSAHQSKLIFLLNSLKV